MLVASKYQSLLLSPVTSISRSTVHRRRRLRLVRAERPEGPQQVPPPPPPPPPAFQAQQSEANPRFQDLSWKEFKERYLRPNYLQLSFTIGALTLGLRVASANYGFGSNPLEFLGTCASTGIMCMALAWVLFDFTDNPPGGGNFSSPRK